VTVQLVVAVKSGVPPAPKASLTVHVKSPGTGGMAAEQSTDRIGAIAAYATWSDCGLAAGAFIGIVGMEWAGTATTYAWLGIATVTSTAAFMLRASTPPRAPA